MESWISLAAVLGSLVVACTTVAVADLAGPRLLNKPSHKAKGAKEVTPWTVYKEIGNEDGTDKYPTIDSYNGGFINFKGLRRNLWVDFQEKAAAKKEMPAPGMVMAGLPALVNRR